MKTIVVGYDETEASNRALERAAEMVKAFQAKLVVISVAPTLEPASGRGAGGIDPVDSPQKHVGELEHARTHLQGLGIEADYQAAIGEPAEAIVTVANEHDADLIVLGSRDTGLVQRMLGQSVSDAVAHHAHRDVMIVHVPHEGH